MTESDASLVARAREGDGGAMESLLRRHFRSAFVVALGHLGNEADAEDVCQEALVRAVERLDDCRSPDRFGAWLMEIVRNMAHNRRDYLRVRRSDQLDDHATLRDPVRTDALLYRNALRQRLVDALGTLPPLQRDVVLLHDFEGLRHDAVASRLGISVLMSRRHLSDARKALRAELGDYPSLELDHD